jgi:prefoldin beta subunit
MPDDVNQLLQSATILQQQLQQVLTQKEAMGVQVLEIKKALDELEKSKGEEIYKIAGPILIKSQKPGVLKELKERDEAFGLRLKALEKEEKRIKLKIEDIRESISKHTQRPAGG